MFLEIHDLNLFFDEKQILAIDEIQIEKGELVTLLGPSGCGKSTLLRCITGLEQPKSGEIVLDNENIADKPTKDRNIGFVFQQYALFPTMTVFENVAFPLREQTDLPEELIRDLVLMKLNAVGLRNAAQLEPGEISGGMARRVALARAIALDPQLILYDEPFAGLDPISMGVTANLIRKLNDALHSTSVLVSHDVTESFSIADYVYFISSGKIVAEGTPAEMMESADPYVRQFVHAETDGPVPFHYPGPSFAEDLGLEKAS